MNAMSQGNSEFAARIARIESGAAASKQLLFVGMDEVYHVPLRVRKVKETSGEALFRNLGGLFEMAFAVLLGAVSHCVGQIGQFIVQGVRDTRPAPDIDMLTQFAVGLAVVTVLGAAMRIRWRALIICKVLGVACGVLLFHNAVHQFPELFEAITSKAWVDYVVAHTRAHSILWRGISIPL